MSRKWWGVLFAICVSLVLACEGEGATPTGGGGGAAPRENKPKAASCPDGNGERTECEGYIFRVMATIKGPSPSKVTIRSDEQGKGKWTNGHFTTPVDKSKFIKYRPDQEIILEVIVEKDGAPGSVLCTIHKKGGQDDGMLIASVIHGSKLVNLQKGSQFGYIGCVKPKDL